VELVTRPGHWVAGMPRDAAVITGDDNVLALLSLGRVPLHDTRLTVSGDRSLAEAFAVFFPGLKG
jgi:hypothetical protein